VIYPFATALLLHGPDDLERYSRFEAYLMPTAHHQQLPLPVTEMPKKPLCKKKMQETLERGWINIFMGSVLL
jgi:hypothetical protein